MKCLYCGIEIPPTPKGKSGPKRTKYCSWLCQNRYRAIMDWRKRHGGADAKHCVRCGKLLFKWQNLYCSKECRHAKLNGYYGKLVYAILKQAKEDGALEYMFRTGSIYQLLPGTDPDYLQRLMKGETR